MIMTLHSELPSDKHTKNYGTPPFFLWVDQLQMATSNSKLWVYHVGYAKIMGQLSQPAARIPAALHQGVSRAQPGHSSESAAGGVSTTWGGGKLDAFRLGTFHWNNICWFPAHGGTPIAGGFLLGNILAVNGWSDDL